MKRIAPALVVMSFVIAACGGDGDGDGGEDVVIPPADAGRVAQAGLPTLDDLPGDSWLVTAEDEFDSDEDNGFLTFIAGNPECRALEDLATLEGVFGASDEEEPLGRAQVEFQQQDPDAFIPTTVEAQIEVDDSAAGSRAEFAIVRALFESDETSDCLIAALNSQFAETGPRGISVEVTEGSASASAPQGGARIAFDIDIAFAGVNLEMAMQMYFWPYGNANVQALFLGAKDRLNGDLVGGVLDAVNDNLQSAAGQ